MALWSSFKHADVVQVGATQLLGKSIHGGEQAVKQPDPNNTLLDFYSGGGFSNIFERPSYQKAAVTTFLDKYAPNYGNSVFNHSGRGFPVSNSRKTGMIRLSPVKHPQVAQSSLTQ